MTEKELLDEIMNCITYTKCRMYTEVFFSSTKEQILLANERLKNMDKAIVYIQELREVAKHD